MNEVPFSERSFRCNSGLLIPVTKSVSQGDVLVRLEIAFRYLPLYPKHEFAHSFIRISDQCVKLRPFDQFKLGWSGVSQKCLLNFCD